MVEREGEVLRESGRKRVEGTEGHWSEEKGGWVQRENGRKRGEGKEGEWSKERGR